MRVATRRLEKSRQYANSIRCKRASLIQPQQTQSAFHAVHNETLSAAPDVDPQVRNSFRRLHNKLKMRRAAPMWRNGRRNGLKIRSHESEVWVRIPPSAPLKTRFYWGKTDFPFSFEFTYAHTWVAQDNAKSWQLLAVSWQSPATDQS